MNLVLFLTLIFSSSAYSQHSVSKEDVTKEISNSLKGYVKALDADNFDEKRRIENKFHTVLKKYESRNDLMDALKKGIDVGTSDRRYSDMAFIPSFNKALKKEKLISYLQEELDSFTAPSGYSFDQAFLMQVFYDLKDDKNLDFDTRKKLVIALRSFYKKGLNFSTGNFVSTVFIGQHCSFAESASGLGDPDILYHAEKKLDEYLNKWYSASMVNGARLQCLLLSVCVFKAYSPKYYNKAKSIISKVENLSKGKLPFDLQNKISNKECTIEKNFQKVDLEPSSSIATVNSASVNKNQRGIIPEKKTSSGTTSSPKGSRAQEQ